MAYCKVNKKIWSLAMLDKLDLLAHSILLDIDICLHLLWKLSTLPLLLLWKCLKLFVTNLSSYTHYIVYLDLKCFFQWQRPESIKQASKFVDSIHPMIRTRLALQSHGISLKCKLYCVHLQKPHRSVTQHLIGGKYKLRIHEKME